MRHDTLPRLLLLEPYFVLRHTIAAVARELRIADIVEATSLESATQMLEHRSFDACLVSVGDERQELALIQRLRDGVLASRPDAPVAVTAATVDAGLVLALKEMHVSRIVLKPFKVKVMLETLATIVDRRAAETAA